MIRVIRQTTTILVCLAVVIQPLSWAGSRCRCGGDDGLSGLPFTPSTSADASPSAATSPSVAATTDDEVATSDRDGCCGPEGTNAGDGDVPGDGNASGGVDGGCSCAGDDCRCRELEHAPPVGSLAATVFRVPDAEPSLADWGRARDAIASCGAPRRLSLPDVPIRSASRQVTLCRWRL